MRRAGRGLFWGAMTIALTACGIATTVGADYEPGLDFGPYRTFGWDEASIARSGDVRLENNPFFEARLYEAIERELSNKGIRRDETAPELLVHYHLSVQDHIDVYEADPTSGYPATEFGPGTNVVQYEEGTFIIHFVDAATGEDLWVGWARGNIGPAMRSSSEMRAWVNDAVAKMFVEFPVVGAARAP